MNAFIKILKPQVVFLFVFCLATNTSFAKTNDTIRQLELQIETLKKDNAQLQYDMKQLEELQYQNIRQYHDDMSSDLETYMTWVGILAALLTIIVALVSILIPIRINNGFEARIKDWFSDFRSNQNKQLKDSLRDMEEWALKTIKYKNAY